VLTATQNMENRLGKKVNNLSWWRDWPDELQKKRIRLD
jgi:hypothetical protein